jgi:hypothetical protein
VCLWVLEIRNYTQLTIEIYGAKVKLLMINLIGSNMQVVELGRKSKSELVEIRNELIIDKMKLNKFFSVFLDENPLDESVTDTNEWFQYKTKLKEYQDLTTKINWANFYLNRSNKS